MNRTEFIALTAVTLFVAFALGWFAHWVMHRFSRVKSGDIEEVDRLAQQVNEAEEQRDQAVAYYQQREKELTNELQQTNAELSAAMDGLRGARHEAEELRAYIERVSQAAPAPPRAASTTTPPAAEPPPVSDDTEPAPPRAASAPMPPASESPPVADDAEPTPPAVDPVSAHSPEQKAEEEEEDPVPMFQRR